MNSNASQPLSPGPVQGDPADGNSGGGTVAIAVLSGFAVALVGTPLLRMLGAGSEAVALTWIAAARWTIVASFILLLGNGLRHRDWSAFMCEANSRNDENLDWSTRTGRYALLRIREQHLTLMHDGDRWLQDHDRVNST